MNFGVVRPGSKRLADRGSRLPPLAAAWQPHEPAAPTSIPRIALGRLHLRAAAAGCSADSYRAGTGRLAERC